MLMKGTKHEYIKNYNRDNPWLSEGVNKSEYDKIIN